MFFVQNKYDILAAQNLRGFLPISHNLFIHIYPAKLSIHLGNQFKGLDQWNLMQNIMIKDQQSAQIIECYYHPKLKQLIFIISLLSIDNIKNWQVFTISIDQLKFGSSKLIWNFIDHPTKYQNMELNPRIICFNQSDYWVILRQFYNDSQCIVIESSTQKRSFFINQQYLTCFDQQKLLINKRSYFKNRLQIDIIDISLPQYKPVKYRIQVDGSGVLLLAKKIMNDKILLGINWRQKQSEICVYDTIQQKFTIEKLFQGQRILKIFWFGHQTFCNLLYEKNQCYLKVYKITKTDIIAQNTQKTDLQWQQWTHFNYESQNFIMNFTLRQKIEAESQNRQNYGAKILRVFKRPQGYMKIMSEYFQNQSNQLIQEIYKLLNQR